MCLGVTTIRPVRPGDLIVIQRIERAAGELFRDVGMADIADHPDPPIELLTEFQRAGRGWVAVDDADRPVAFVLVLLVDGDAHIEQVSVHPAHMRRGVGRDCWHDLKRNGHGSNYRAQLPLGSGSTAYRRGASGDQRGFSHAGDFRNQPRRKGQDR